LLANLPGVQKLSPRLCVASDVAGQKVTVTGILPQSEYAAQAAWQSVALFSNKHVGCKKAACGPDDGASTPESLAVERAISDLQPDEVILGADVAELCDAEPGQPLEVMGVTFTVLAKLPRTGTVDDSRVFAHLHTIQRLADAGEVVNAIEVCACCQDAASTLLPELAKLLPDAKVVTISNVVATQVGVNRLMSQVSVLVLGILVTIGGASVASTISANVRDRRREIGTLMAIGATPRLIAGMFLLKSVALGGVGAFAGCVIGTAAAMLLGGQWAGVAVSPLPALSAAAIGAAVLVTALAAFWPARTAAKLDPCICFREA
jgi:putative ABC transport system permease protein